MIPSSLKSGLKSLIYKTNAEKPKLEVEKDLLREIYKKSIVETETLINQDLSSWKLT
jgi:HEPN domain-containing protein